MTPLRSTLQIVCATAALCCCEPSAAVLPHRTSAAVHLGEHPGIPYLVVHRKEADAVEVLATPACGAANDVVQLGYVAAGKRFGAIVSVDGNGAVTLHFPISTADRGELSAPGLAFVPQAFELDDAPGFERFFFVAAQTPIDVERVLAASYALGRRAETAEFGRLNIDPTWSQSSFLVRKPGHPRADHGHMNQEPPP